MDHPVDVGQHPDANAGDEVVLLDLSGLLPGWGDGDGDVGLVAAAQGVELDDVEYDLALLQCFVELLEKDVCDDARQLSRDGQCQCLLLGVTTFGTPGALCLVGGEPLVTSLDDYFGHVSAPPECSLGVTQRSIHLGKTVYCSTKTNNSQYTDKG